MNAMSPIVVPMTLHAEEWLAALQEAMRPAPGAEAGKTVRELVESTGLNERRIRVLIAKLQAQGRVSVKRTTRTAIDGRASLVPVYFIIGGDDALHRKR